MSSSSPTLKCESNGKSALPATPDNSQTVAQETSGPPAMPPPPPFNTPMGTLGSTAGGGDEVTGAALSEVLSRISINENASGKSTATSTAGRSGEEEEGHVDDDDDDEEEDDDEERDNEVELPPEVMKRLYQLKALQSEKDVIYEKYTVKRAELEMEFASAYGAVYSRRAEVVAGRARDVDGPEGDATSTLEQREKGEEEDSQSEIGIPHFWMQCMLHHEALHDVVCEPDLEALYYLSDVRCVDKKNLLGFTLEFHFDDNPYFTNAVLSKRYDTANIMDQGEPLLEGVEGTPIDWKAGRNLCEKTIKRKIKRSGSTRMITKTEKLESFFKFFQNPVMYDDDDEEEDEEYNFSFDMDYEVARIFRNHLIPNAVLWFTGEAVSDEESDEETDEEEGLEATEDLSGDEGDGGVLLAREGSENEGTAGDGEGDAGGPATKLSFQVCALAAPCSLLHGMYSRPRFNDTLIKDTRRFMDKVFLSRKGGSPHRT
ncbi:unnamed protein product [Pylaiella littoralis]